MAKLHMAKASLRVKRRLSPREVETIRFALDVLVHTPAPALSAEAYAMYVGDCGVLSDDELRALVYELGVARKVKLWGPTTSVDRVHG